MEPRASRRRFLGRLAAVLGGLAAVPGFAQPALAGRSRRRWGWGGWGGRGFYGRRSGWRSGFRGYGYGRGFYGGWGGYGGYGIRPFGGYGVPYVRPYGGYYGPGPGYYGGGYYPPMILKRQASPLPDALGLLEA